MAVPSNISLFNYRIHNDLNCDFCLHLCLHEELLDSVPKSVYSPSFFIFANLLIFKEFIYKFIVHELPPPFEDSLYKQRES